MQHFFLVAFGQGVGSSPTIPPREAADEMRRIIDNALNVFEREMLHDLAVSVAPNCVMLALPDATPDRAIRLAEAVQGQLQHAARRGRPIIAVCSVVTFGPMRPVNVLGYSSNFEGRPPIAAARILAKLEPGCLAVEKSAWWAFEKVSSGLGDQQTLPGKHANETFSIRVHQGIKFGVVSK